jgi:Uncharacterized membrane-associated protein/domain
MSTDISDFNDSELSILKTIRESESGVDHLTQRELSRRTGISLGMINILLRRFAERGWVKLSHVSAKSVHYALTPAGISELTRRTAGYFSRASKSADLYRDRLEAFALEAKRNGAATVVLIGESELETLLAYVCDRHGIVFVRSADPEKAMSLGRKQGVLVLLAENLDIGSFASSEKRPESLAEMMADGARA